MDVGRSAGPSRRERRVGKNTVKTFVFMALLTALLLFTGTLFRGGYFIMVPIVFLMNFAAYFWSDKMVLKATKSRPVTEEEAPWLYRIVRELAQKSGMPMPKLYIMPAPQPNAFATGRNPQHAAVAVTEGILRAGRGGAEGRPRARTEPRAEPRHPDRRGG